MKENKIFLVISGYYSDWDIEGYFENEEQAKKYCAIENQKRNSYDSLYVNEVDKLGVKKYSNTKFKKYYKTNIRFTKNIKFIQNDGDKIREDGYEMYVGETKKTKFSINRNFWFSLSGTFTSQEQCNKATFDYLAELREYTKINGLDSAILLLSQKIEGSSK